MKKKQAGDRLYCLDCGERKLSYRGARCAACSRKHNGLMRAANNGWTGGLQLKRPDDGVDLNLVAE